MKYVVYKVPNWLKPEQHKAVSRDSGVTATPEYYQAVGARMSPRGARSLVDKLKKSRGGKYVIISA